MNTTSPSLVFADAGENMLRYLIRWATWQEGLDEGDKRADPLEEVLLWKLRARSELQRRGLSQLKRAG
jgi:hypothetical protein